jgi:hypothetical protein
MEMETNVFALLASPHYIYLYFLHQIISLAFHVITVTQLRIILCILPNYPQDYIFTAGENSTGIFHCGNVDSLLPEPTLISNGLVYDLTVIKFCNSES